MDLSNLSIGLDENDVALDVQGSVSNRKRHMMGKRWEKDRVARYGARKMFVTWTDILSISWIAPEGSAGVSINLSKLEEKREVKKDEKYKQFLMCKGRGWSLTECGYVRGWCWRREG